VRAYAVALWHGVKPRLRDPDIVLFILLLAIHLVPIWGFRYFPAQDGPAHLNNANALFHYNDPDATVFREYYVINRQPDPNWFGHIVLGALMLLLPTLVAEKVFLSAYVFLLPWSVRYAARAVNLDSGYVAALAFPFIYNYLLHMGFYNFAFSLPVFFFAAGYWFRYGDALTLRRTVALSFLVMLLYFCHLVSVVVLVLLIGTPSIAWTAGDAARIALRRFHDWRAARPAIVSRTLTTAYALLPTAILAGVFVARAGTTPSPPGGALWIRLRRLESLVSYQESELGWTAAFVWVLVGLTALALYRLARAHRLSRWDWLAVVVGASVWVYFVAPDGLSGGGFISHRMNLYPFLTLLLWLAVRRAGAVTKWMTRIAASTIALGLVTLHIGKYAELNDYLAEYTSGQSLVERNSTLLPLCFSHQGVSPDGRVLSARIGLFLHAAGHIAAERGIVELDNYEANTGYFPLTFRGEVNPFWHIGVGPGLEAQPPCADFATYPTRTKGHVDYVLLWGMREDQRELDCTRSILQQLADGYELIYTSPQRGMMQLYRRKLALPSPPS